MSHRPDGTQTASQLDSVGCQLVPWVPRTWQASGCSLQCDCSLLPLPAGGGPPVPWRHRRPPPGTWGASGDGGGGVVGRRLCRPARGRAPGSKIVEIVKIAPLPLYMAEGGGWQLQTPAYEGIIPIMGGYPQPGTWFAASPTCQLTSEASIGSGWYGTARGYSRHSHLLGPKRPAAAGPNHIYPLASSYHL